MLWFITAGSVSYEIALNRSSNGTAWYLQYTQAPFSKTNFIISFMYRLYDKIKLMFETLFKSIRALILIKSAPTTDRAVGILTLPLSVAC